MKGYGKMWIFMLIFLPVFSFTLWIYYKDKYNKEGIHILLKYFILGIIVSFFAIIIEHLLLKMSVFENETRLIYLAFVVAGFTEEVLKGIILIIFTKKEKSFDEKLDGIMYSIFLTMGFVTVENLIYVNYENVISVLKLVYVRTIISIPAHIMFAITMGYYLSRYKFEKNVVKRRQELILMFLLPIIIHGIFDFILMIEYKWVMVIFLIYVAILAKVNLDNLSKYISYSKRRFHNKVKKNRKRK